MLGGVVEVDGCLVLPELDDGKAVGVGLADVQGVGEIPLLRDGFLHQFPGDGLEGLHRDLALRAMVDAATEKLGPENCLHPALEILRGYDREADGEYLNTLRVYSLSSFSSR